MSLFNEEVSCKIDVDLKVGQGSFSPCQDQPMAWGGEQQEGFLMPSLSQLLVTDLVNLFSIRIH